MITRTAKTLAKSMIRRLGYKIVPANDPEWAFHSHDYLRHNARRLEHLASLRIPVAGMTVLEVGAGIGDHSHYYLDRGCKVTITEARPETLQYLLNRYPNHDVQYLDMEHPTLLKNSPFDIVHCYGLLYHLNDPEQALEFLSNNGTRILFLETCVSFGHAKEINIIPEDKANPTQALSGTGCRPTRPWLFERLQGLFKYVYLPKTQPNHEEFPLDWTSSEKNLAILSRAVFIASRQKFENDMLSPSLINYQARHE